MHWAPKARMENLGTTLKCMFIQNWVCRSATNAFQPLLLLGYLLSNSWLMLACWIYLTFDHGGWVPWSTFFLHFINLPLGWILFSPFRTFRVCSGQGPCKCLWVSVGKFLFWLFPNHRSKLRPITLVKRTCFFTFATKSITMTLHFHLRYVKGVADEPVDSFENCVQLIEFLEGWRVVSCWAIFGFWNFIQLWCWTSGVVGCAHEGNRIELWQKVLQYPTVVDDGVSGH